MSRVLVTGGSGFIGSYCVIHLLRAGHDVRTTVRNVERENEVRALVNSQGLRDHQRLTFVQADLKSDDGWVQAATGCEYVLHVASPFHPVDSRNENDLIAPARDGTLRVLHASLTARVRRVVLTSSFAAIGYGHEHQEEPFGETNWTNLAGDDVTPYVKSKTLAERAAWDWMSREGRDLELAVVNPVGVFGPVLGPHFSNSISLVRNLLNGMPGCPRIYFGVVDVRDVADLHIRAMSDPGAKNQRFIATAGEPLSMLAVASILRAHLGSAGDKLPTRELPDDAVRQAASRNPMMSEIALQLGRIRRATNAKAKRVLGWAPRPNEEVVLATAESLLRLGIVSSEAH